MNARERIRLDSLISWSVSDGKLEPGEEGPAGLSGIQSLGTSEIFEVLVIRDDRKGVLCSLQPVSPFL